MPAAARLSSDLRIRIGVGIVFDQQIDSRGDRRVGIGDGAVGISGIVEIQHVDRQGACRQLETAPQLQRR